MKRVSRAGTQTNIITDEIDAAIDALGPALTATTLTSALVEAAEDLSKGLKKKIARLCDAIASTAHLRFDLDSSTTIIDDNGSPVDFSAPGMHVRDLGRTHSFVERTRHAGAVATAVFRNTKTSHGTRPTLFVVDEAQNYVPEQQTGWLSQRGRRSSRSSTSPPRPQVRLQAAHPVSDRPGSTKMSCRSATPSSSPGWSTWKTSTPSKDCFEAAGPLLDALPSYDTGTGYAAGVALLMGAQVAFPRFDP